MNKKLTTLLAALAVLGALVGAKLQNQEYRYNVYRGFNDQVLKCLEAQGESYQWEGRNLVLTTRDRDHLLASLSVAAEGQEKCVRVYYQNLGNRTNVQGADGHPYRRLIPAFDEQGVFCGATLDQSDYFWVTKPGDPRAVLAGAHAGQVAYPNVCLAKENILLSSANEQLRRLGNVMSAVEGKSMSYGPASGMFNGVWGEDPFSSIGSSNAFTMLNASQPQPEPTGHQCTADCISMPDDIPILAGK